MHRVRRAAGRSPWRGALAAICATAALVAVGPVDPADAAADAAGPRVEVEIPGPEHGGDAGSGHARVPAAARSRYRSVATRSTLG
ncbi:hypothetical protein ACFV0A_33685, partial [Streptomyces sp. NPDC059552]